MHYYTIPLVLLAGILLGILLKKYIKIIYKKVSMNAKMIKQYWLFVSIFIVALIATYISLFTTLSNSENFDYYLSITNTGAALTFAIFVGYFAFLQAVEGHFERIVKEAEIFILQGKPTRAINKYRQALSIKKDDFSILANLAEMYLLTNDSENFIECIPLLKRTIKEPSEKLIFLYLKTSSSLLKQQNQEAKELIKEIIEYTKKKPIALRKMFWNFGDLTEGEVYTEMQTCEAKKILNNLILYLSKALEPKKKKQFETGDDYTLDPPTPETEETN